MILMTNDTQFGFRNGLGTREALFKLNVMSQGIINQDIHIQYMLAFELIRHDKRITNITREKLSIVKMCNSGCKRQNSWKSRNEEKCDTDLHTFPTSTLTYIQRSHLIGKALDDQSEGTKVNCITIKHLRYADDTVVLAETPEILQI